MSDAPAAVSVVIPTYNGARFIREALDSVFAQTAPAREIIVVDDASTDDTVARVSAVADCSPIPLRLIRLPKNSGGPARPLNVGIRETSGEFIAVLDQDDLFEPDKIEAQQDVLRRRPEAAFVFSCCRILGETERAEEAPAIAPIIWEAGRDVGGCRLLDGKVMLRLLLLRGCFVVGYPGFLFRRSLWERKGGVNEGLRICSDYDFLCWLCTQGDAAFLRAVHFTRREHASNMCRRRTAVFMDSTPVKLSYALGDPGLRRDAELAVSLRNQVDGLAYWLRESGRYLRAARYHLLAMRTWGADTRACVGLAKVLGCWAAREPAALLTGRGRRPNAESVTRAD